MRVFIGLLYIYTYTNDWRVYTLYLIIRIILLSIRTQWRTCLESNEYVYFYTGVNTRYKVFAYILRSEMFYRKFFIALYKYMYTICRPNDFLRKLAYCVEIYEPSDVV